MHLDCERSGARLAVRLITGQNQSCGTFITPFIPGKFRPTPLKNDGTRYTWKLDYDPDAADGRGQFTFMIRGDAESLLDQPDLPEAHRQEARIRFPNQTTFTVDLPEGYKQQGTTFDHFGLMNMMKPGGQLNIYFDDLKYEGRSQDFSQDPHWDASGNRVSYQATDVAGAHNFGFSPTQLAGGQLGEVGGTFWRTDRWGYYADKIGPLSLADRLEARGRVVLVAGGPDSDMCFGWFRTNDSGAAPNKAGDFLGIKVGGPTRVGHYFLPAFTINEQVRGCPTRARCFGQARFTSGRSSTIRQPTTVKAPSRRRSVTNPSHSVSGRASDARPKWRDSIASACSRLAPAARSSSSTSTILSTPRPPGSSSSAFLTGAVFCTSGS